MLYPIDAEVVAWEYANIRKCDNSATSFTLNCSLSYKHITVDDRWKGSVLAH